MALIDQDIFDIAQFIISNFKTFMFDYKNTNAIESFEDYLQSRLETDLNHKYNKYDIQEAFEDERMQMLLAVITNKGGKYDTTTKIH